MFKAIRIGILLLILAFVGISTWLTQARSTDWNNSLWVKVYPINADGSDVSQKYIDRLKVEDFTDIETFVAAEVMRDGPSTVSEHCAENAPNGQSGSVLLGDR